MNELLNAELLKFNILYYFEISVSDLRLKNITLYAIVNNIFYVQKSKKKINKIHKI